MMAATLAAVAFWAWFCLVLADRPARAFLFGLPMLSIVLVGATLAALATGLGRLQATAHDLLASFDGDGDYPDIDF